MNRIRLFLVGAMLIFGLTVLSDEQKKKLDDLEEEPHPELHGK